MYNDLFSIGSLTVHTYGVMTAVGILAAYFSMEYRTKKAGLDANRIFALVIWCLVFGYACSKLLYIITILPELAADPSIFRSAVSGGWVIYGGILGGILGGYLYCRWRKLPAWKYFDLGMTSVVLAQGFGRLGCFFAGCCYGAETDSALSIVFRHSDYAPNGVHLIPTQLYSSIFDFLLFFFLLIYHKRWKKKDGEVLGLYLIIYSAGRFFIEFFRGDLERGGIGPLSTSQFIGLFTLAAGVIIFILRRRSKTPEIAETASDAAETAAETSSEGADDAAEEPRPDEESEKEADRDPGESFEESVSENVENAGEDTADTAETAAD